MYVDTDLHGHTFFSDGRATPEEYVEFRQRLGMKAIAIADHDVLAAVRRGAEAAQRVNMFFVPALEVTSFLHFGKPAAEQFHVLAYYPATVLDHYRLEATHFYRRGVRVQERWREFVLEWMSKLEQEGKEALDPDGAIANMPAATFPALQSMILIILERQRSLFEVFRDHHAAFWESDANKDLFGWTPEEAIEAIRGDGAVDIVAHPTRYRDKELTQKAIGHASGIEVYTSRHKAEVAEAYREMAERLGKHWTSSSDDHQNARYIRPTCGTPVRTLERICRKTFSMQSLLSDLLPPQG